jgi:hypothetical protein
MPTKGLIAVALITSALSFDAMAIELGSFSTERFNTAWTLDGIFMENSRAKLLNPNNFGPQGTVPESINITDVSGEITYTALSPFNVFFSGYLPDNAAQPITEDEGQAFFDWVSAGGTLIITCDDNDHDSMCIAFGLQESASSAVDPVEPTVAGANRPLFDGPFGTPTSLDMASNQPYFTGIGGFSVLAEDQNGDPVVLESVFGDGRVVAFTDVDMVSDSTLSDGSGILNDNDQFWGNLIAYLNDESDETFFVNAGLNGNWWGGPSRNGEGAQLEIVDNGVDYVVVLTFYSYDSEGNQIFLIAVGNIEEGNTTELDVFITEGGMWGPDFDPSDVTEDQVGTAVLTAYHCGLINIAFDPNTEYEALGYEDLEYDFTRLATPIAPCPVAYP